MKQQYLYLLIMCIWCHSSFGQNAQNENYLPWSSTRKLMAIDFVIKTSDLKTNSSFAQFSMEFEVGGFAFMAKNFNKKVHNYFIKSASWLDTTYDVNLSIIYQQTLFDICEIYTRCFRRELKENRKKMATGMEFIKELNAKAVTEFAKRRIEYDSDTKFGTDSVKQQQWETQIQSELMSLKEYASE